MFTKDFLGSEASFLWGLFISCTLFAFHLMNSTGSLVAYANSVRFLLCLITVYCIDLHVKLHETQVSQHSYLEERSSL